MLILFLVTITVVVILLIFREEDEEEAHTPILLLLLLLVTTRVGFSGESHSSVSLSVEFFNCLAERVVFLPLSLSITILAVALYGRLYLSLSLSK